MSTWIQNFPYRINRKIKTLWFRNRDVEIAKGYAKGLLFRAGRGNPEYIFGTYELPVQEKLASLLKPGMVFYDVGANIGFFTIIAANIVGPNGKVYAFEPLLENTEVVRHNVSINHFPQVQVFQKAVTSTSGKERLFIAGFSGGSALETGDKPPDLIGEINVETVSIDDLVRGEVIQAPDVVKIDVEGAEVNVLEGMRDTIQKHRPVVIYEIDDHDPQNYQKKQKACEHFLAAYQYSIQELEEAYPGGDWIVGNYVAFPLSEK